MQLQICNPRVRVSLFLVSITGIVVFCIIGVGWGLAPTANISHKKLCASPEYLFGFPHKALRGARRKVMKSKHLFRRSAKPIMRDTRGGGKPPPYTYSTFPKTSLGKGVGGRALAFAPAGRPESAFRISRAGAHILPRRWRLSRKCSYRPCRYVF